MRRRFLPIVAMLGALSLLAAACTSGGDATPSANAELKTYDANAQGEGELNLIIWPLYAEKDIVKPFERETGCQVTTKDANTSDQMVNLMRQQGGSLYDGVSASGDATLRLIANGDVAGIDVDSFPNYGNVMESLKAPAHNTVDGVHYGVPYEWGPNVLMYNTDVVSEAPTSWDIVFEDNLNGQPNPYDGKLTAYDSPIYIADAAMYLKTHRPELGIDDPYELNEEQLQAATDLLSNLSQRWYKPWAIFSDEIDGFESGDMVAGTAWPVNENILRDNGNVNVSSVTPDEGVTGWADTWMMSSNAAHPVCMMKWMEYTLRDNVQAATAYTFGATPSVSSACNTLKQKVGETNYGLYHCGEDDYLSSIYFWKTPLSDCGDGNNDCTDYNTWTQKWTEVRGS